MSGKDDRSKEKRRNMKQYTHHKPQPQHQQQRRGTTTTTSSSSPQTTAVRSIVDVADSSDEPRFARKGNWASGGGSRGSTLAPQMNRDLLDVLPSDTDDVDHLGIDTGAPIDENARAQLRAGDYKQLTQFPNLGGGHFTFGSEKEWTSIAEGQTQLHTKAASGYFTLNLVRLNAGLQTIPFYKRMDYPASMFTRQQIVAQTEAAERAETLYQQRVLREANGSASKSRAASAKSAKVPAKPQPVVTAPPEGALADDLEELLAMTNIQPDPNTIVPDPIAMPMPMPMPMVQSATPTSAASKNDVENWLDNVLGE
ncbi:uncharacterized protein Aven [Drosophila pseudoobscura]|uniref:Uncharacterized protein Aven n=1 Tax=Drosophila pseudoobscura pseudoobscura TaxID=46245 RepID=A0A6I8W3M0_DROPS|nr:uncharacterized protein LOC4815821 [Drosophila pseudoobscura]XP_033237940.1 uncharacterized protein LOC4815821 [Drosophila pseudoobscura]XP_033237941.1 uncharacterized protein LOC4815821 [Drosophila pseudoobscura]